MGRGGERGEGSGQGFKGFPYGRVANYGKESARRFGFSGFVSSRRRPCPARCHTTLDLCRCGLPSLFFSRFPSLVLFIPDARLVFVGGLRIMEGRVIKYR